MIHYQCFRAQIQGIYQQCTVNQDFISSRTTWNSIAIKYKMERRCNKAFRYRDRRAIAREMEPPNTIPEILVRSMVTSTCSLDYWNSTIYYLRNVITRLLKFHDLWAQKMWSLGYWLHDVLTVSIPYVIVSRG